MYAVCRARSRWFRLPYQKKYTSCFCPSSLDRLTRRLRAELHAQGYCVGRWRIRRVLAAAGLRAQQPRSFVLHDSDPNVRAASNRLLDQPAPTTLNQVWVGDITYLPKQGGWLFLATWLDRYPCKVVGFGAAPAARRTCVKRCPKTWSARRYVGPWPYVSQQLDWSSILTRAANTPRPTLRS